MRLICPNCEAQYEVSDDAIPPGGRDVQCSNCNQSWFQTEKPTSFVRRTAQPAPKPAPAEPAAEPEAAEEPAAPPRRKLDDAVASILREEAARTAATPVAAAAPVATSAVAKPPQTEAPRPKETVTTDETLLRIAQMTEKEGGRRSGTQEATADTDDAHLRSMPSINEINATLRARAQANDTSGLTEQEKYEAVQRSGFRRGFFLVLVIFALVVLPYVFADQITENLPQTRSFMASYVTTIDQIRITLSELVSRFTSE